MEDSNNNQASGIQMKASQSNREILIVIFSAFSVKVDLFFFI